MSFWKGKKVCVTGGTGLIGSHLVPLLREKGAHVITASLDECPGDLRHYRMDLTHEADCRAAVEGMDAVFHLAGIKGNPKRARERPAGFMIPMIEMDLNIIQAARKYGVGWFLYTSSVGGYAQADLLKEEDFWRNLPSANDLHAGWAKRTGELALDALRAEHGWAAWTVVRPANVYGPHDRYAEDSMVITALVHRALAGENPLRVWGDGNTVRDFIHAADVARGMTHMVERGHHGPVNLGSGAGTSIAELAAAVSRHVGCDFTFTGGGVAGDDRRVMCTKLAESLGFKAEVGLDDGVKDTVNWFRSSCR